MDNKKPENNNKFGADLSGIYKFCAVMIALGIVLFVFALKKVEDIILRSLLFAFAAFIFVFAIMLISSAVKTKRLLDGKINFFLYDKHMRKNKSIDTLSFKDIREKIRGYMSAFKRGKKLYIGDLFDENIKIPSAFRPLFCYELLYEMTEDSGLSNAKSFLSFGNECAGVFYIHLIKAGDVSLAEEVKNYFSSFACGNVSESDFVNYLKSKKQDIESSVMKYVKEHINEF